MTDSITVGATTYLIQKLPDATYWVVAGHTTAEREFTWKTKHDRSRGGRAFYVHCATGFKTWVLPKDGHRGLASDVLQGVASSSRSGSEPCSSTSVSINSLQGELAVPPTLSSSATSAPSPVLLAPACTPVASPVEEMERSSSVDNKVSEEVGRDVVRPRGSPPPCPTKAGEGPREPHDILMMAPHKAPPAAPTSPPATAIPCSLVVGPARGTGKEGPAGRETEEGREPSATPELHSPFSSLSPSPAPQSPPVPHTPCTVTTYSLSPSHNSSTPVASPAAVPEWHHGEEEEDLEKALARFDRFIERLDSIPTLDGLTSGEFAERAGEELRRLTLPSCGNGQQLAVKWDDEDELQVQFEEEEAELIVKHSRDGITHEEPSADARGALNSRTTPPLRRKLPPPPRRKRPKWRGTSHYEAKHDMSRTPKTPGEGMGYELRESPGCMKATPSSGWHTDLSTDSDLELIPFNANSPSDRHTLCSRLDMGSPAGAPADGRHDLPNPAPAREGETGSRPALDTKREAQTRFPQGTQQRTEVAQSPRPAKRDEQTQQTQETQRTEVAQSPRPAKRDEQTQQTQETQQRTEVAQSPRPTKRDEQAKSPQGTQQRVPNRTDGAPLLHTTGRATRRRDSGPSTDHKQCDAQGGMAGRRAMRDPPKASEPQRKAPQARRPAKDAVQATRESTQRWLEKRKKKPAPAPQPARKARPQYKVHKVTDEWKSEVQSAEPGAKRKVLEKIGRLCYEAGWSPGELHRLFKELSDGPHEDPEPAPPPDMPKQYLTPEYTPVSTSPLRRERKESVVEVFGRCYERQSLAALHVNTVPRSPNPLSHPLPTSPRQAPVLTTPDPFPMHHHTPYNAHLDPSPHHLQPPHHVPAPPLHYPVLQTHQLPVPHPYQQHLAAPSPGAHPCYPTRETHPPPSSSAHNTHSARTAQGTNLHRLPTSPRTTHDEEPPFQGSVVRAPTISHFSPIFPGSRTTHSLPVSPRVGEEEDHSETSEVTLSAAAQEYLQKLRQRGRQAPLHQLKDGPRRWADPRSPQGTV